MSSQEWFNGLKVGDRVKISSGPGDETIGTVQRRTPTRVTVNGRQFHWSGGRARLYGRSGDAYFRTTLHELTEDAANRITAAQRFESAVFQLQEARFRAKNQEYKLRKATAEQLNELSELLEVTKQKLLALYE